MTEIHNPDAPATENQIRYLKALTNSRDTGLHPRQQITFINALVRENKLTRKLASDMIDAWAAKPQRKIEIGEGYYILDTDLGPQYAHVKPNRAKTGVYAERLVDGRWTYEKGLINQMHGFRPMTEQEVADFGHRTQRCLRCQASLSNSTSVRRGYGDQCAKHLGITTA